MQPRTFEIVERGTGTPLVLIPGIQGRWEYARGIVEALARFHRVITFSLIDERTGRRGAGSGMDLFADQVESALQRLQLQRAIVVGISFGGLVALRFAATRPARTQALVMVSAPGPLWHLRPRHDLYARLPWLFGPLFLAEVPIRLAREVTTALPGWPARLRYLREQWRTIASAPVSLARLAARARLIGGYDRIADCALVTAPSLIVQGDQSLDHVTGAGGTAEYARLIAGARLAEMPRTGHLGSVTRADDCADILHRFLIDVTKDSHHSAA
ncbi:MAG TPA: alpha/beta hydrolase [Vicinamibacterales bacterium]|nr:alpha/beta hydrolase [Vicinamibacterales bacterium]